MSAPCLSSRVNQTEPIVKPRVLFVAAEAVPLAKTGGLGDAVSGLAAALQERNVDVTLLMPGYPQALASARGLRQVGVLPVLPGNAGPGRLLAGRLPDSEITIVLLDSESLFNRAGSPYADAQGKEFTDNGARFAALSYAASQISAGATDLPVPHVVHAHDWHAGLTPMMMRQQQSKVPSVQTIHNLAFQGLFPLEQAAALGIPDSVLGADGIEFWGQLNYLKAGIRYADQVTTVSHSYAREILTPRFGHGLEGLLQERREQLGAIPNGVDVKVWDPASDASLPATYTADRRQGKAVCKHTLQCAFNLRVDPAAPLLVHGSRLTTQKMADVAVHALAQLLQENRHLQVAILGCGEPAIEENFCALALQYPGRVGVHIGYEEDLAHLLHAGGDMLLHGSRFEPYGLTPVYAMRYGTVPIASRVGGLMDTVCDIGRGDTPASSATGFLFDGETAAEMAAAIRRALSVYQERDTWQMLVRNGMRREFSWAASAAQYAQMYAGLTRGAASLAFAEAGIMVDQPAPAMLAGAIASAAAGRSKRAPARKPQRKPVEAKADRLSGLKLA